jgi:hypothetical protein
VSIDLLVSVVKASYCGGGGNGFRYHSKGVNGARKSC